MAKELGRITLQRRNNGWKSDGEKYICNDFIDMHWFIPRDTKELDLIVYDSAVRDGHEITIKWLGENREYVYIMTKYRSTTCYKALRMLINRVLGKECKTIYVQCHA